MTVPSEEVTLSRKSSVSGMSGSAELLLLTNLTLMLPSGPDPRPWQEMSPAQSSAAAAGKVKNEVFIISRVFANIAKSSGNHRIDAIHLPIKLTRRERTGRSSRSTVSVDLLVFIVIPEVNITQGMPASRNHFWSLILR